MTSAPVTGIGNIILSVREMARSLAVYRDAIGLSVRTSGPETRSHIPGTCTTCPSDPYTKHRSPLRRPDQRCRSASVTPTARPS